MRFGHFDDAKREYVIETPRTPLPWINYLGSEDFFALVSNISYYIALQRGCDIDKPRNLAKSVTVE